MPRGGKRENAGVKSKWKQGKTKTIRVPEALATQVLEIARILDEGQAIGKPDIIVSVTDSNIHKLDTIEYVTDSKIINLSEVTVYRLGSSPCVLLRDLITKGYQILPEKLADKVIDDLYANQIIQANKEL